MLYRRVLACTAAVFLSAMKPISPVLDTATTTQTVEALKSAGLTEVATSSVLRSLEQVLNTGDAERTYLYREPYDHLALVDAASKFSDQGCMKVELSIWMAKQPDRRVALSGVYCRTDRSGAYEWKTTGQEVRGRL